MAEAGWPRHAVRIGVFEFRRTVRAVRGDTARSGLIALGLLFPSALLVGFALLFEAAIRGAGPVALPDAARGTVAMLWLFGAFIVAQRVATARTRIEADALVLTTVSARTAAGGLLLAETLRALAYVTPPLLTLAGTMLYLFGSLLAPLLLLSSGLLLVATAVTLGSVAGYAVAWLVATSRFVARHRTALGAAGAILFFGGYAALQFPGTGLPGAAALAPLPVGWLADLAVVGTPIRGSGRRAVGAVLACALVLLVGGALLERASTALWFTDPVSVDDGDRARGASPPTPDDGIERDDPLAAAIRPLAVPSAVDAPTRRVAEWVVLRTRRDPRRLTFLLLPVVFLGSALLGPGLRSGSLAALAAPLSAVVLPWVAGALFAMNPLGDEGAVLPVTLTAVPGRRYVRGLALPGLLFGPPVVAVATATAGLFSPYTAPQVLGLVLVGLYLTAVSVAVTPAVGMRLPRFGAISVGRSRTVLPPRIAAVVVHGGLTALPGSLLVLLVVAPGLARTVVAGLVGYLPALLLGLLAGPTGPVAGAAAWFGTVGRAVRTTDLGRFRLVLGGLLLVGGALVAAGLYRNAVVRFDRYEPP